MGRLSVKPDAIIIEGQKAGIGRRLTRRHMDHYGKIVVLENPLLAHGNFATPQFFIRRADDIDRDGQIRHGMKRSSG